jgi:DNA-directed RNA polymerase specialized sigma subunit
MEMLSLDNLEELCEAYEPPIEVLSDPYAPANDPSAQQERRLRAAIAVQVRSMRSKHAAIARLRATSNDTNAQIAEKVGLTPVTVSNVLRRGDVRTLLNYLHHYSQHRAGSVLEHRKAILHRIAIDNEKDKPSVSITAIAELNKIDGSYKQEDEQKNTLHIVINNELLPRTTLDVVPEGVAVRET